MIFRIKYILGQLYILYHVYILTNQLKMVSRLDTIFFRELIYKNEPFDEFN